MSESSAAGPKKTLFGRRVRCPECGAPVIWRAAAEVVECRYCGTHVHAGSGERTAEPAAVRSNSKHGPWVAWIFVMLLVGIPIIAALARLVDCRGKASSAQIAAVDLATPLDVLQKKLTGLERAYQQRLTFRLDHALFQQVTFRYEKSGRHVVDINLAAKHKADLSPIAAALKKALGRRYKAAKYGSNCLVRLPIRLALAKDHLSLDVSYFKKDHADWRERIAVFWRLVTEVVFGRKATVSKRDRRAFVTGYPLAELAQLDLRMPVDRVAAAVTKRFPGSRVRKSGSSLDVQINLDHPLFIYVSVWWQNAAGGVAKAMLFRPPGITDLSQAQRDVLARCLKPVYGGAPRARVADHLAGKKHYTFGPPGQTQLISYLHHELRNVPPAHTRKLLAALASCK